MTQAPAKNPCTTRTLVWHHVPKKWEAGKKSGNKHVHVLQSVLFLSVFQIKLVGSLYGTVQVLWHILNFERYMFSSCTKASSSNTVKSKALRIPRKTRSHCVFCVFSNSLAATGIVLKWGGLTYCKPLLIMGFSLNGVKSSSLLCLKGLHFLQVWIQLPDRRNFCSSQEV